MKTSILSLLIAAFFISNFSFAQGNASSYYRKIASEQRKIRSKQTIFYKTTLLQTDENRLIKGRDMVTTQLAATMKNVSRMPAYKGDSALRNDYMRILNTYMEAYTVVYDSVRALSKTASESESNMRSFQDAFYYMEDLVDDCEYRWTSNEDYFTGTYTVNAMVDPTLPKLNTLRSLSIYVEDMRATYSAVPYKVEEMLSQIKKNQFDNFEDLRQGMGEAAEEALLSAKTVNDYVYYVEEDERADDYLLSAVIDYLENIKEAADLDLYEELSNLDEARYDEDEKKVEKSKLKLEKILQSLLDSQTDLNERIEQFVLDYAEE